MLVDEWEWGVRRVHELSVAVTYLGKRSLERASLFLTAERLLEGERIYNVSIVVNGRKDGAVGLDHHVSGDKIEMIAA